MSQSTTNDLLSSLGLSAANVEAAPAVNASEIKVTPSRRKHLAIGLIAAVVFGAGFKLIGDYAADKAIEAWTARQTAEFSAPSPLAVQFLEAAAKEEAAAAETAHETPAATDADSVSRGE